ncbi:hypothetical protein [Halorarius halobius]|uniref:hypothetical protein n=1 Tax=Halorarius halobius TaxID=2962671 RepID=UPI0020CE2A52|nr:hypothetical protein [Halorarius halobius]
MSDDDATEEYGGPSRDLDRDETAQDTGTTPDRTTLFRIGHFLAQHFLLILSGLGLLAFVIASFTGVGLPRNLRVIGLAALIIIPLFGRPIGSRIVSMLWEPSYIWIVDLDARVRKGGVYRVPIQQFREWTVTDGSLDWLSPNLAVGKNVDLVDRSVDGTWRGTYSDRDLLRALEAVKECRGQLEEDAKKGFAIETHAHGILRRATKKAVLRLVSTFERGSLPDKGDGLTEEIDAVIDEYGIERKIREAAEDNSPTSEVPGLEDEFDPHAASRATVDDAGTDGGTAADD